MAAGCRLRRAGCQVAPAEARALPPPPAPPPTPRPLVHMRPARLVFLEPGARADPPFKQAACLAQQQLQTPRAPSLLSSLTRPGRVRAWSAPACACPQLPPARAARCASPAGRSQGTRTCPARLRPAAVAPSTSSWMRGPARGQTGIPTGSSLAPGPGACGTAAWTSQPGRWRLAAGARAGGRRDRRKHRSRIRGVGIRPIPRGARRRPIPRGARRRPIPRGARLPAADHPLSRGRRAHVLTCTAICGYLPLHPVPAVVGPTARGALRGGRPHHSRTRRPPSRCRLPLQSPCRHPRRHTRRCSPAPARQSRVNSPCRRCRELRPCHHSPAASPCQRCPAPVPRRHSPPRIHRWPAGRWPRDASRRSHPPSHTLA
eukprot:scaffold12256_cov97-Isochrysis_galbana.AAC.2